jgi:hypothetical protein
MHQLRTVDGIATPCELTDSLRLPSVPTLLERLFGSADLRNVLFLFWA